MKRNDMAALVANMKAKPAGGIYTITDNNGNKAGVIDGRRLRRKEIANAIKAWRSGGYRVRKA